MKNSYMADIVAITGQFKKPLFFDLQNIWLGIRQSASGTGGRRYRCLYGFHFIYASLCG
jgi:hypothetical protein